MPDSLTPAALAELDALERAATPGPWSGAKVYEGTAAVLAHGLKPVISGTGTEADVDLCAALRNAAPALLDAADERDRLRAALERIERWFGEFPPTGRTWSDDGESMSYGAAFGSNGERDYMRAVARAALAPGTETEAGRE